MLNPNISLGIAKRTWKNQTHKRTHKSLQNWCRSGIEEKFSFFFDRIERILLLIIAKVIIKYFSLYLICSIQLVLMSLDRYLAVAHPIRSISLRTVKNANRAILVLWVFILIFCIPTIITHNVSYDNYYSVCTFLNEEYNFALYQVIFCLFSYIIPIFLIIILYILMLNRLWFTTIPGRNMSSESLRSKKKVTRMVVIVVIIFACCWCPIQIILVLKSFNIYQMSSLKVIIQITGHVLGKWSNCFATFQLVWVYSNKFYSIRSIFFPFWSSLPCFSLIGFWSRGLH